MSQSTGVNAFRLKKKLNFLGVKRGQKLFVYVVLFTMLSFFSVFFFAPFFKGLYMSFHKWQFLGTPEFVGLKNYIYALTEDKLFLESLKLTGIYCFEVVSLSTLLALFVASLISRAGKLMYFFRITYYLPLVIPLVISAILWKALYQTRFGIINDVLMRIGLPTQPFLNSTSQALSSIAVFSVWATVGYPIILFIAGIQGIPQMYQEAARIDGANVWQIFVKITLPLLKPTITFVLITSIIGSMQVFTQIYIMVSSQYTMALGGPAGSTLVTVLYIYVKSFLNWQMGYASALSFILFLIIAAFTLVQFRALRMKWKY